MPEYNPIDAANIYDAGILEHWRGTVLFVIDVLNHRMSALRMPKKRCTFLTPNARPTQFDVLR